MSFYIYIILIDFKLCNGYLKEIIYHQTTIF